MADRTALTAGIAAASIAAVVAATPALITPPNNDVQITAAAVAAKKVSADVQLAAFTLAGFLNAFANGYDGDYDDNVFGDVDTEASGEAAAIYYTLDNLLPEAFDYDDHILATNTAGSFDLSNLYYHLAVDLGVDEDVAFAFVSFLIDPLNTSLSLAGVPAELLAFINDPITTIVNTVAGEELGEVINHFINNPITDTINLVGGDLGPLVNQFINFPISTVINTVGGDLGPLVNAFINNPVGTTAALLGDDVLNFVTSPVQEIARVIAAVLGAQQNISTLGLKSGSDETVGITSTETKAPKLFKLDLPTPEKVVSDIESVFTPKKKVVATEVEKITAVDNITDGGESEAPAEAPAREKPKPGDLVKNFNKELGQAAKSISDSFKPKPKADDSEKDKSASSDSDTKKKPSFGGFGHRHKKTADAPAGGATT